ECESAHSAAVGRRGSWCRRLHTAHEARHGRSRLDLTVGRRMSAPLVKFDHATLGYGRRVVLSDLSFDIPPGDFLGLVGPNGAGKTTILRAILGTLRPMSGTVAIAPNLRFGYVPQRDSVDYNFPLKVIDVVLMGRYDRIGVGRRPTREDRQRAIDALDHVGIADLAERQLSALSGGQKQRTLIARALVGEPN